MGIQESCAMNAQCISEVTVVVNILNLCIIIITIPLIVLSSIELNLIFMKSFLFTSFTITIHYNNLQLLSAQCAKINLLSLCAKNLEIIHI